jgi:hypothetical protein
MNLEAVTSCQRRSSKLSQAASSCRRGLGDLFWDWFVARELCVLRYHYNNGVSLLALKKLKCYIGRILSLIITWNAISNHN